MQVVEKGLEAAARAAFAEQRPFESWGEFDARKAARMGCEHPSQEAARDIARAAITAYLSARSAEPVMAARADAKMLWTGFLMVKPDGTIERLAPEAVSVKVPAPKKKTADLPKDDDGRV